jgi:hypothetical protein
MAKERREYVTEGEFRWRLKVALLRVEDAGAVTGPGRSGAVASAYTSYLMGIPFLPYGAPCPDKLRPLLIVDTARKSGRTLRKADRLYGGGCAVVAVFEEPPRVRFWYEGRTKQRNQVTPSIEDREEDSGKGSLRDRDSGEGRTRSRNERRATGNSRQAPFFRLGQRCITHAIHLPFVPT